MCQLWRPKCARVHLMAAPVMLSRLHWHNVLELCFHLVAVMVDAQLGGEERDDISWLGEIRVLGRDVVKRKGYQKLFGLIWNVALSLLVDLRFIIASKQTPGHYDSGCLPLAAHEAALALSPRPGRDAGTGDRG